MQHIKRSLIASAIIGLAVSVSSAPAAAQTTGTTTEAPASLPKVTVNSDNGTIWIGTIVTAKAEKTAIADKVKWTLTKNSDAGGDIADERTLPAGTAYPVSTYAALENTDYTLTPTFLQGTTVVGVGEPISLTTAPAPKVLTLSVSKPVLGAADTTIDVSAIFSNIENPPDKVVFSLGDKGTPIEATPGSDSSFVAQLPVPSETGVYQVRAKLFWGSSKSYQITTKEAVSVVRPPKIVVAKLPKLIDPTGAGAVNVLQIRAINTVREDVLSSISTVGGVKSTKFRAEWTLPNGDTVGQAADKPIEFQVSAAEYPTYVQAAQAAGVATPVYPVKVKVFHPDYPDETTVEQTITMKLGVPWEMPDWNLVSSVSGNIVAPASVIVQATPGTPYDVAAARLHKLKYEWQVPADNITGKATADKLRLVVGKEGSYPIQVKVTDDRGNVQNASITLRAVAPTLKVDAISGTMSPLSGRYPVTLSLKAATSSTHPAERVKSYEVKVDGTTVHSGPSIKPFTLTTPGEHTVTVIATSNMGSTAEKSYTLTVADNQVPVCQPLKQAFSKNNKGVVTGVAVTASCVDKDGKVKSYAWQFNGQPVAATSPRASYGFKTCETSVDVLGTVTDDSGGQTTISEVIPRGGNSDCVTAGN